MKQTSSKHQAGMMQAYSVYTCTTCALIASCLLDVCFIVWTGYYFWQYWS